MKYGKLATLLIVLAFMVGCGNKTSTGIAIFPTSTVVVLNGTQQFTGTVSGNSNTNVNWFVSFQSGALISGGNSTLGTVSSTGLYTAPATLPDPPTVSVVAQAAGNTAVTATATVTLDSGIRVVISPLAPTMGTGETLAFSATVTGTSNTAVTWEVNGATGGTSGTGTISPSGVFTAPSSPQTVTVAAVSVADINESASTTVTVDTAADPTLLTLDPTVTGQGSVQQSVYLTGTNFYTTSVVLANTGSGPSIVLPTTLVSNVTTSSVLTVTLPANLLQNAGSVALSVQRQNGDQSAPLSLTVTPVRPAIVSASPNSTTQGNNAANVTLDGGYYSVSTPNGPHTQAEFNGIPHGLSATNTRQASVTLSSADQVTAGLFSLVLQNTGVPAGFPAFSAVNVGVQPQASSIPLVPIATIPVGVQPVSVAVDTATGIAVVANAGTIPGTLNLVNLATNTLSGTVQVGHVPTSVAVDNLLDEAVVVNSGDNTLSVVSLSTQTVVSTINLPSNTGATGYSIGINPLTHRALVANSLSDVATVVDLSATPPGVVCVLGNSGLSNSCAPGAQVPPVSTGVQPSVAIYPRLNWAVVAPGGSGAVTIIDLGLPPTAVPVFAGRTPQVIATVGLVGTPQGIAVNPETGQSLIADPNNGFTELSLLNQTTSLLGLDKGEVADAINPLTNMAVSVNSLSNHAAVIDMQTLQPVLLQNQYIQTGLTPVSVDIDPVTNEAIVANSGAGANSVSVLSLGAIRPLHVIQSSPATTYTSSSALTLTVVGGGFDATSAVRLDQSNLITTVLPAGCTSNCRELTAAVPVAMLGSPRRFILDVLNQDTSTVSNVTDLTVMASVTVGTAPGAVAIDSDLGIAVVTNTGDGTINTINLTTSAVSAPIIVGSDPEGVAILPQSSEAVVTNFGSNNVSIINLILGTSVPLATGTGPLGVSINPDTNTAAVANNISNTLSLIDINIADTPAVTATINTDMNPLAVAIDPTLNYAAVTASGGNGTPTVVLYDLVNNSTVGRISGLSLPSGVVFDPVAGNFVIANSLQNNIVILVPTTLKTTSVSTGINPYSLDYNYQTSTLVTANSLSGTLSVMDYLAQQVEAVLPIGNSSMFSVAIDLLTNIAVVADQANNRVLLVPLPH